MNKLLLLILFLTAVTTSAQFGGPVNSANREYFPAVIEFENGTIQKGFAVCPRGPRKENIDFKSSENATEEQIDSERLAKLIFNLPNKEIIFERNYFTRFYGKNSEKISNEKVWMVALASSENLTLLKASQKYYISGDNKFYFVEKQGSIHFGDMPYLFKKADTDNAVIICSTIKSAYQKGRTRKNLVKFFNEYPDFVKRIGSYKIKFEEIDLIIEQCLKL
ncbi:hypothetical protein SAMN05216480_1135 [Pustulibacterium marinum]|uniref:GLPGLI family protein n=1 Tax=Pustulibacterium marinum TaxID=1224947 RepID=A0A1I7I5B5_9FLAO|nr:hypothetical protein [Pustulibacterium marinum]SFU68170.1 hypothetical protein SAMN05216480_1135 [Pustulibacterium marinum]